MIYTKEFNNFFESFDTGNKTPEELELIKTDMFSGWEARQSEIDELKSRISELTEKYETRIRKLKEYIEDLEKEREDEVLENKFYDRG